MADKVTVTHLLFVSIKHLPERKWRRLPFVSDDRRYFNRSRNNGNKLTAKAIKYLVGKGRLVKLPKSVVVCSTCDVFLTPEGEIKVAHSHLKDQDECFKELSDVIQLRRLRITTG